MAVAAAPLLAAQGRIEALALYAAFSPFCHQYVDRSWHLLGEPLAVCLRCLGVYCGAALGSVFVIVGASARHLVVAAGFCGGSWLLEVTGTLGAMETPAISAAVRLAAGGVLGFVGMQVVARALADPERSQAGLLR